MIEHILKIIYRSFVNSKVFLIINLLGLSTGLACTLLIYLWIKDELNFDKFNKNDSRLFQVMVNGELENGISTGPFTPGLLAESLKEEIFEIEYSTTTGWINSMTVSTKDKSVKANGWHVGQDYFKLFSFPLIFGQPELVLKDKTSIVISRELAEKLFNHLEDALGKTVEVQHNKSFQISGIFDRQANSTYQFDFALSFEEFKDNNKWVLDWDKNGPSTFLLLKEGSNPNSVAHLIKDFVKKRSNQSNITLFLQQYSERYLYDKFENGIQTGGRIEYIRLFAMIAAFIMLIACINFINLSTAKASRKVKEVGIKKSLGSPRSWLIIQFLSESILIAFLSFIIAIVVVRFFLPFFNQITVKQIKINLYDPNVLTMSLGIVLLTGLLSGIYPAIILSRLKPSSNVKGLVRGSLINFWVRKGLVVVQFLFSIIFLVSMIVMYEQIDFIQNKNLGFDKANLIRFPVEGNVRKSLDTYLEEVKKLPGVVNASSLGHILSGPYHSTTDVEWGGKNSENKILFEVVQANYNLIETIGIQLIEGRSFSKKQSLDTAQVILNESAIKVMGLKNVIGEKIKIWGKYFEVIGVVKDFHFQSLHDLVNPLFFVLTPNDTWITMIRLEPGKLNDVLVALSSFYNVFNPGFVFEYSFLEESIAKKYEVEQRLALLSRYFAGLAILISCLGLFGLSIFTVERRFKEIGIRKVLGSSSINITLLLCKDFTKMVLVSIFLGLPLSYWLLNQWLARFAYRIPLEIWYFISAGILTLIIAWITVAFQAVKAASGNPVNSLRVD